MDRLTDCDDDDDDQWEVISNFFPGGKKFDLKKIDLKDSNKTIKARNVLHGLIGSEITFNTVMTDSASANIVLEKPGGGRKGPKYG